MSGPNTLLIVDDQPTNRRILVGALQKAGYHTLEAGSGVDAVRVARERRPDLILMDVCMPNTDGFTACEQLKSCEETEPIPIVFLTAQSSWEDIERAFAVGGSDYITKPFRIGEVKARVSVHLQLRVAQQELEEVHAEQLQSQKLQSIGELAAGIAHEINTPMQYIGDNTRFLQEALRDCMRVIAEAERLCGATVGAGAPTDGSDELRAAIADADLDFLRTETDAAIVQSIEGIERVNRIVRAMKEFSHPSGRVIAATDLNRCVENTITLSRNEWKHVATLDADLDADLPLVECASDEIGQVLLNLMVNAAHAVGEANEDGGLGTISVSTRRRGDLVELRIADTGGGIPEEIRDRVFDPFFTTKGVGRGTGQGLAIAHAVIQRHGGTIHFDSVVGEGTTFMVRLPLEHEDREQEPT